MSSFLQKLLLPFLMLDSNNLMSRAIFHFLTDIRIALKTLETRLGLKSWIQMLDSFRRKERRDPGDEVESKGKGNDGSLFQNKTYYIH